MSTLTRDGTAKPVLCVFFPFILDIKFVGRKPGSHRRKVTQDFSSTFVLRFSRPVLRQPVHSPHADWIRCLLTAGFLLLSAMASTYYTVIRHRVSPKFIGSRDCGP